MDNTLQNYLDQFGAFKRTISPVQTSEVSNFNEVEGATTLILEDDGTTNTLLPSNIVSQVEPNFEGYTT